MSELLPYLLSAKTHRLASGDFSTRDVKWFIRYSDCRFCKNCNTCVLLSPSTLLSSLPTPLSVSPLLLLLSLSYSLCVCVCLSRLPSPHVSLSQFSVYPNSYEVAQTSLRAITYGDTAQGAIVMVSSSAPSQVLVDHQHQQQQQTLLIPHALKNHPRLRRRLL